MTNFDELLDQAQLPGKHVPICLRGDLLVKFEELEKELDAARESTADSLAAGAEPREVAEKIEALREQMRQGTVTFVLRALSDEDWRALLKLHPARVEDYEDLRSGFNRETMGPALIKACIVEPAITEARLNRLRTKISPGEFAKLDKVASDLNFKAVSIPFSLAASQILSSGSE